MIIQRRRVATVFLALELVAALVARGHAAEQETPPDDSHFRELYSAAKYDDALVEAQKLLTETRERLGANSMDSARALNRVANVYFAQGKYDEAEGPYRTAVATVAELRGAGSPELSVFLANLASDLKGLGRYDEAAEIYARELSIKQREFGSNSIDAATVINLIANVRYSQKQYGQAEELYRHVMAMIEQLKGTDSPDLAVYLNNLGNTFDAQIRYNDAEAMYARELAVEEKAFGPDSLVVASTLKTLGSEYLTDGRYRDAEQAQGRALAIREKILGSDSPDVAVSLNELANVYSSQIRLSEAEQNYKRALVINERNYGSDSAAVATNLNNLGNVYSSLDRFAEAEAVFKRSLAIRERLKLPTDIASTLHNLGENLYKEGRFADSEDYYKRSLLLREQALGMDHPDVAQTLTYLGLLYQVQGKNGDAEAALSRALAIIEKRLGPQHPTIVATLDYLAGVYYREEKYDASENLFKRAIAILEQSFGPNHPELAMDVEWLGVLYQREGDYARAEPLFKRAVELKEGALGPDHNDVGTTLAGLGNVYHAENKLDEAEKAYRRALNIKEKVLGPHHSDVAMVLHSLANVYYEQKKYDQAEDSYRRAIAISKDNFGPDHPNVASSLSALANLYKAVQKYADAEDAYKSSLATYDKTLSHAHRDVAYPLNNLIDLYGKQRRYADALPLLRRAIVDKQAWAWVTFPVLLAASSAGLIESTETADDSLNIVQNAWQTSAGEALNALSVRFSAGDGRLAQLVRRDQDLRAEEEQLRKAITDAVSKEPAKRDSRAEQKIRDRIGAIAKERDDIEDVFVKEFPDYAALSKPQPLVLRDIQSLLAEDEALILVDLGTTSYVWAITKTAWRWSRLTVAAQQATQTVSALRALVDPYSLRPFDPRLSFQLYQQLFGPIETTIADKPRLSFVLNGALTGLPPQVLVTADPTGKALKDVDWLIRRHAVTVLPAIPSLRVLRGRTAITSAQKPLIGFADPIFDSGLVQQSGQVLAGVRIARGMTGPVADIEELRGALPPLPDTVDEVRQVAASVNASVSDVFIGPDATVTRVKETKLDQYRIVYFATHGLLAGEVADFVKVKAEPALVLTLPEKPTEFDDGLLTASEVAQLKLDAEWVVLSACNTAAGERPGAEALSGLARAFFYAGGRSLLVSNWEVETKSAVALMVGTFAALAANPKLSHGEALQKSMLAMINDPQHHEWADPKFWAPFVVVGEPAKPVN
jgi:CHAT domain-containing protein/Tfp pilus assembly protein PilF